MNTDVKFKFVSLFSAIVLGTSILTTPALAVVNGQQVPDPKADAPYVVSIWNSDTGDSKDASFECTGTLIAPQIVLTAAHCTTLATPYFVKVGATALRDNTAFIAVSGVWQSDRYKPQISNKNPPTNDIGLFKLTERFENIPFPTLASSVTAKKLNKYTKLKIFGWGYDQNRNFADLLRTSNLLLQDGSATKIWGKSFNIKSMISAGIKIKSENIWSGACSGDSGGPLISNIDGINVLVGITSWGAENCSPKYPSIFARASYYEKEIKTIGIPAVEARSVAVNRTAPIAIEEPELIGEAKPGNKLKCSPGKWSNAVSVQVRWESPARVFGSANSEISVLASDGGTEFKCVVLVSAAKTSVRRVLRVSITGSAVLASNPVIAGIVDRAPLKTGQTARCEGWNWRTPVDSERVTWFTSASSQPSVPVNARQIGSGASLTFDSNMLKDENGRYLICQVTGIQNGFESHFIASKYMTTPSAPTLSSVSINASSLTTGSGATCSFNSYGDVESTRVDWGYTAVSGYFTQYPGLNGERIQLTRDLVQQAAGKYLACRVTLSNSGGEVSKSANTYNTFASLPNAPIVSAYISGSVIAGSTARCSASSSYDYGSNLTYAWGKTTSNGSRLIEGEVYSRSTSYTLTSSSLDNLAGAYLTCVVTLENDAGSVSSASSISIPNNKITIPQPTAPIVETQIASSTSISVKIRVPSISGFDESKMIAKLNVIFLGKREGVQNCTNLSVTPGSTYECPGLMPKNEYSANISVASKSGEVSPTISPDTLFSTIELSSLVPKPTFSSVTPTSKGFTFQITNYSSNYNWQASITSSPDGEQVEISNSGLVSVTNLDPGDSATVTIRTSRVGFNDIGSASITGSTIALLPALIPTFSSITSNSTGFTFQITNYNPDQYWKPDFMNDISGISRYATVEINSTGLVTVAGIISGTSATIKVGNTRSGYSFGSSIITGSSLSVGTELKIIAIGPDSDGITNIGVCFTNPAALSGNVTYNISGASFGSFLKHSGTPACPSFASGSNGLRLSPNTSYNYSATASNNGVNYSATLSFRTPAATTLPGLTPTFGARVADTYLGGFKYQITNYNPAFTWSATTTSGEVSISSSGLVSVIKVPARASATLTITSRRTGYETASASITSVSPWDLSAEIQTQNITATLSGTTLTVNVPDAKGWTWTLMWDGYVQRSGITSFPYVVNNFAPNRQIDLGATDSLSNYGYSKRFLPTPVVVSAPSQPSITSIIPTTNNLAISWATPASNGGAPISQYWAYVESAPAGATVGYCSTTGALTCTVSGLLANTTYYVIVSAWNTVNGVNRSSGDQFSPRTTIKTLSTTPVVVVDTQIPTVEIGSITFTSPSMTGQVVSIPTIGNISDGIATNSSFTVTFRVIDQGSGVLRVWVGVDSGSEDRIIGPLIIGEPGWATLVSGNRNDGIWTHTGFIPSGTGRGRYSIRVAIDDSAGNATGRIPLRKIDIVAGN